MRFLSNKFSFCLFAIVVWSLTNCSPEVKKPKIIDLVGKTMGSGYSVSYKDSLHRNFQPAIDSLLNVFNQEISTYLPDSRLLQFNRSDSGIFIPSNAPQHLLRNFKISGVAYGHTAGWFNPAVMPLVNYWGFGKGEKKPVEKVDSALVDSLRRLANYDAISIIESEKGAWIRKSNPKLEIVFNAIAPGDAADEIGKLLESKGIKHYMVEVGGEVRTRGLQTEEHGWIIGINTPKEGAAINDMQVIVELRDMSLATSGNYRNFIEVNGVKYAHTINPFTGYPEKNSLLSASIFTKDCGMADALATACMAMGLDKAWSMVNGLQDVEAYFIYSDDKGNLQVKYTDALEKWIKK